MTPKAALRLVAVAALPLLLAACGDDTADTPATPETTTPVVEAAPAPTPAPAAEPAATLEPGLLRGRVVNLLAVPVDVYVRTTGVLQAASAEIGVAAGGITAFHNPPTGGAIVITTAGAGDATCVISCDHIIATETLNAADGDTYTIVLYDDGGTPRAMRLYETAPASIIGQTSNAMVAADPATGLVVVTAVAVTGADFGLRLGYAGVAGCQEPANLANVLVGGNQTPAFAYGATADLLLYDNQDRECAGTPVGGPFTVAGGPGTRTHLILSGAPGTMAGIVLAMEEPAATP